MSSVQLLLGTSTWPILDASEARRRLYRLIDEACEGHEPVLIRGRHGNAVLLSEEEWNGISETLCLHSISGMRESIQFGMQTPIDECTKALDW